MHFIPSFSFIYTCSFTTHILLIYAPTRYATRYAIIFTNILN
jgi:hypothetical protein